MTLQQREYLCAQECRQAMRANDPRAVPAFELVGFRRCTREEYQAMKRRLMREEAEQHNNERGASTND